MRESQADTIVVGAGQAGLATAREVRRRGGDVLVLEAQDLVGGRWPSRWDSLVLFTPAERDGLPGMPFPAGRGAFPTKDEVAGYLHEYARRFELPVRLGERVTSLDRVDGGFRLDASTATYSSRTVVIATGPYATPRRPGFAEHIAPAVFQLHSANYRNPDSLPAGDVVVVGAGTAGAQIALELAATRRVFLAGRPTVHIPDGVLRHAPGAYWAFLNRVLTVRTPIGRQAQKHFHDRGAPLIRISIDDVRKRGVTLMPRVAGADAEGLLFEDGRRIRPEAVLWATGFAPDLSWLPCVPVGAGGAPITTRGVVSGTPGLYTVGMPFQYALTSGLLGGVGRDATYVAEQIVRRRRQEPGRPADRVAA